jgi:hypothetical protein
MKKILFYLFIFLSFSCFSFAQVILPYVINKNTVPADSAKITQVAPINAKPGYLLTSGLQIGDMAPDFILYDTAGRACQLSHLLAEGKPVLLVSVSLTCPRSRRGVSDQLKKITTAYGKDINIRLIYVIDAHPMLPDVGAYSIFSNETIANQANMSDRVCHRQPITYLERKELAKVFIKKMNIHTTVVIDDPANSWWSTYGPAAHNAYLLTPGGMVYAKEGWFDDPKSKLSESISTLLADNVMMKTDFSEDVHIGKNKTSADTMLFVNSKKYAVNIVDENGKSIFRRSNIRTEKFDFEKHIITKGQYAIIIKTSSRRSYCLRYDKP